MSINTQKLICFLFFILNISSAQVELERFPGRTITLWENGYEPCGDYIGCSDTSGFYVIYMDSATVDDNWVLNLNEINFSVSRMNYSDTLYRAIIFNDMDTLKAHLESLPYFKAFFPYGLDSTLHDDLIENIYSEPPLGVYVRFHTIPSEVEIEDRYQGFSFVDTTSELLGKCKMFFLSDSNELRTLAKDFWVRGFDYVPEYQSSILSTFDSQIQITPHSIIFPDYYQFQVFNVLGEFIEYSGSSVGDGLVEIEFRGPPGQYFVHLQDGERRLRHPFYLR